MKKKLINPILFIISITLILYASYHILFNIRSNYKIKELNQSLQQYQNKQQSYDFANLKKQNNDTIGWIKIENTKVDYPIVQSIDNKYYLNHDFKKQTNEAGWIFMDFRNQSDFTNLNNIIYGHGRIDGSMFGNLKNFLKEDWLKNKEQTIKITTPTSTSTWKVFSVYTIKAETYYLTTYFPTNKKFQSFLETIKKRSMISFDTAVSYHDNILTLSTCKNNTGQRIVIHAKKETSL